MSALSEEEEVALFASVRGEAFNPDDLPAHVEPVPPRPYARIRSSEPSITTVMEMIPKPGLKWGAAKESAIFAVLHQEEWRELPEAEAIDRIKKHHDGLWRSHAAFGTLVHMLAEARAKGEQLPADLAVAKVMEDQPKSSLWGKMHPDEVFEQCLGYVVGFDEWWDAFCPEPSHVEQVVRCPGFYVGTLDLRARIFATWPSDGFVGWQDCIVDYKTTHQQDEEKGLYFDSYRAQLCALAFASETVEYGWVKGPRGQKVVEIGTGSWTPPERTAIVHLRGDEGFSFLEVPVTKDDHAEFVKMADNYRWVKACPQKPLLIREAPHAV